MTGKAGEVVKVPTRGAIGSPLLVLVGSAPTPTPSAVRRARRRRRARASTNAASVALALPADSAGAGRRRDRGLPARRLHVHRLQERRVRRPAAGRGRRAQPDRRRKDADHRLRGGAGGRRRPWPRPATGSTRRPATSPRRPSPTPSSAAAQGARKGRGAPKVNIKVLDEKQLAELGCGGILGVGGGSSRAAAAGRAHLLPQGRQAAPRAGRQGHHLRLGRPDHQARREHARR